MNKMKYTFQIKKYDDVEYLVVCIKGTPFDQFLNTFFEMDGIPLRKELLAMIYEVKEGIKEDAYFDGYAFEIEIKKDFSKISTDYPVDQLSKCEIKTEELIDILSAYSDEIKKYQ